MNKRKLESIRKKIDKLVDEYSEEFFKEKSFIPGVSVIPPSSKVIDTNELKNMVNASLDGHLTTGTYNKTFEKKLSNFLDMKYLMTVNSGSSANLIAFSSLTSERLGERTIKKGDEIITVAASFPTTINPMIQFGAIPVFVDVDIPTYNINYQNIENCITKKTKAIMIAHTLGNPFNLHEILKISKKYNLWLVEDTCDALGSTYDNKLVGTFGDIGTLSFYPAHHITMGEGGAVFTKNSKLKRVAESFRDWGRDCYCEPGKDNTCKKRFCWKLGDLPYGYDHKYIYSEMGYNLKITDMQAACGLAQLDKLELFIESRKQNFNYLYQGLSDLTEHIILPEATPRSKPSWFGFPISLKGNLKNKRQEITTYLNDLKIGTRLLFSGNVIKQPYFKKINFKVAEDLKNTEYILHNTFWLGVHPALDRKRLDFMIDMIRKFILLNS